MLSAAFTRNHPWFYFKASLSRHYFPDPRLSFCLCVCLSGERIHTAKHSAWRPRERTFVFPLPHTSPSGNPHLNPGPPEIICLNKGSNDDWASLPSPYELFDMLQHGPLNGKLCSCCARTPTIMGYTPLPLIMTDSSCYFHTPMKINSVLNVHFPIFFSCCLSSSYLLLCIDIIRAVIWVRVQLHIRVGHSYFQTCESNLPYYEIPPSFKHFVWWPCTVGL